MADNRRGGDTPGGRAASPPRDDPYGFRCEAQDLLRAVAGGTIVGLPLLYTMEMWWRGLTLSEWHLLVVLAVALLVNFAFSLFSGFRQRYSIPDALSESASSVGIGIALAALVLWLIGEIPQDLSASEVLGKVLVEAAAVSIGVSFANSQIRGRDRTGEDEPQADDSSDLTPSQRQLRADLRELGAAVAGSTALALSIAPTEEVLVIATRLTSSRLLLLLAAEVLLCYVILFASGLEKHPVYVKPSLVQHPVAETVVASAVSLTIAAAMVFLLGPPEAKASLPTAAACTIALGFPAVVGGAAGRLIL